MPSDEAPTGDTGRHPWALTRGRPRSGDAHIPDGGRGATLPTVTDARRRRWSTPPTGRRTSDAVPARDRSAFRAASRRARVGDAGRRGYPPTGPGTAPRPEDAHRPPVALDKPHRTGRVRWFRRARPPAPPGVRQARRPPPPLRLPAIRRHHRPHPVPSTPPLPPRPGPGRLTSVHPGQTRASRCRPTRAGRPSDPRTPRDDAARRPGASAPPGAGRPPVHHPRPPTRPPPPVPNAPGYAARVLPSHVAPAPRTRARCRRTTAAHSPAAPGQVPVRLPAVPRLPGWPTPTPARVIRQPTGYPAAATPPPVPATPGP